MMLFFNWLDAKVPTNSVLDLLAGISLAGVWLKPGAPSVRLCPIALRSSDRLDARSLQIRSAQRQSR